MIPRSASGTSEVRWFINARSTAMAVGLTSHPPSVCLASSTKPLTSLTLPVGPCEIAHHPDGDFLAVSDLKEKVTFFDRRMVTVDRPVAAVPAAAAGAVAGTTPAEAGPSTIDQASWQANGSVIAANPSKDLVSRPLPRLS
jgi:hypothetical protein